MSSRVWNLCRSLLPREAKRADLVVVRIVVIVAIVGITAVWRSSGLNSRTGAVWASSLVARRGLEMLFFAQALAGLAVVTRWAGDAVGDRKGGFLELLSLSGCTPPQWLATRLLTLLAAVATTWTIPIPFFYLAISFGGVEWRQIAIAEILLLCQLMMLAASGLVVAHGAAARSALRSLPSLVVALEVGQSVPAMLANLSSTLGWGTPSWMTGLFSFAAQATTRRCVLSALNGGLTAPQFAAGCIVPLAIAGIAFSYWLKELYSEPTDEPVSFAMALGRAVRRLLRKPRSQSMDELPAPPPLLPAATAEATLVPTLLRDSPEARPSVGMAPIARASENRPAVPEGATRVSRRSWDDALAWQAYAVFNRGEKGTKERGVLYGGLTLCLVPVLAAGRPWTEIALATLLIVCVVSLFRGMSRAGECLQQEIKESTLPTLMLTPHEPQELHDGWSRGALRLLRPELGLLAVALIAVLLWDRETLAPAVVSVAVGLLSIGPFLTLSPLLPYTVTGIATGLLVFVGAAALAVAATLAGVLIHPWAAPVVLAPLAFAWNRICRSLVASWLLIRLQAAV